MVKTKLFIDTNIYLDYFRKSGESLSSLRELQKLLIAKKIYLVLPAQTKDEYLRLRSNIAEQTRKILINEAELKLNLPAPFMKEWKQSKSLRSKVTEAQKAYKQILKKYDAEVYGEETPADILIKKLFAEAEVLNDDEGVLQKAYSRYLRGHPPRKNDGSYGDAIAWETLLGRVTKSNLVIVTRDSDFVEEKQGKKCFNSFLEKEWRQKNPRRKVSFYRSLGEFVNKTVNREVVKKEVVQKEKSSETALAAWLSASPISAMGLFEGVTSGFSSLRVNPSQGFSLGTSPTFSFNTQVLKYCPYCSKDISSALASRRAIPYVFGDSKFSCPHCKAQFDPNVL